MDNQSDNPGGGGSHPREKQPMERAIDNVRPNTPPDQHGTTSQGWDARDTRRREQFKKIHGADDDDFREGDQHPTYPGPNAPTP